MIKPYTIYQLGDQALLVELEPASQITSYQLAHALRATPGIIDRIPATQSLTLTYNPALLDSDQLHALIAQQTRLPAAQPASSVQHIPVIYDGLDLAAVAQRCGLSAAAVVDLHTAAAHTVALIGFLPGFPYLDGLPDALFLPRRATPRTRVAAGSVAIANRQTGIYPQASPGGWQIIGRTTLRLFDPERSPPALLRPGDLVYFVAVDR